MATLTGRTTPQYTRVYINGYDFSGYTLNVGALGIEFDADPQAALTDAIKGSFPSQAKIIMGNVNGFLDNTATTGLHTVLASASGSYKNVMIPIGIRAAPDFGAPVFVASPQQVSYIDAPGNVWHNVTLTFGDTGSNATTLAYKKPWGVLLHELSAATAVNSTEYVDDNGAASTYGGYMMYQVTSGNGTATIKVQDSTTTTSGDFGDLLTSGSINCATVQHGVVALAINASVKRYVRWQIALGTATTVTFALAFVRGTGV